ncbi:xanthine dehydrogenase small subunit, partial [Burkholderia multivorans]
GYRQTVREPGELITAIRIPLPLSPLTSFQKITKRRFDDISSVAIGYAVDVSDGIVDKARIGLGGVAATPPRALATEAAIEGRPGTLQTVHDA